jgi:SAM-dependent methyltransferase
MDTATAAATMRSQPHRMWAAVADAWAAHADEVDERGAELTEAMLERTHPRPGERVLERACGVGGAGLAAAGRVAPDGEVVLSDVASEMTAIAARRAAARGVGNVSARVLDLDAIAEPDGSYDVVLCREGLMFATDPAAAAREIRRVLRPGGRVAVAVWGRRERNPWLGVVFDAAAAQLGRPVPPPGIPGPFALADAQRLQTLLVSAGLAEVTVEEFPVPLRAPSFEAWWKRTSALAGPLATLLAALPEEAKQALQERLRGAARAHETPAGLEFPGLALLACGRCA